VSEQREQNSKTASVQSQSNVLDADNIPPDFFERRKDRGYVIRAKDWDAMERFEQKRREWRLRKSQDV
jgi:hypothetical protein